MESCILSPHRITIEFDDFGWGAVKDEARRQGVRPEELLVHAAMYYLSDLDTGRAALQIFRRSSEVPRRPRLGGTKGRPRRP
jgi:hypothetical protein